MNEHFENNLVLPGDPEYQYDIQVDFPEQNEKCGWDSDISEF